MVMRSSVTSVSKGGVWKGALLFLGLTALSVLSVNILGRNVSFMFLPLTAVFLWPRVGASTVSVIIILLFGLLLDLLSAGPLGLWSLIFLSVFALFRPHHRIKPYTFLPAFRLWLGVVGFALAATYFLGWFAMRIQPDFWSLFFQAAAAIVLFPIVYGVRHLGSNLLLDSDRGL